MASGSGGSSSVVRMLFPPENEAAAATFDAGRGVELGHFSIIERIRSGGMGAVFRARDMRLNRVVALKILPPTLSRDPLIVQRFKNEAQAAAQLDHENIARVFYVGEEQGLHFIAFEYVTGINVRELIQQQGQIPVGDALNYALQMASALVHTAAQGVVHRDIKPSNIIITPAGRAKLVDLGLARKENRDEEEVDLTMAGTTLGTFDYISPEQARDPRTADVRSDIYSLGCTLYHMLTGAPPYPEGTVLQKLLQHQGDEAPDPAQKNAAVPENLSMVVRKMMAKDPRRRYQNAEQLVRDLMLVAGAMGLRSISPEGLVWLAGGPGRASFWERHLAWMATVATLLLIVGILEYAAPGYAPRSQERLDLANSPGTAPRDARGSAAGTDPDRRTAAGPSLAGSDSTAERSPARTKSGTVRTGSIPDPIVDDDRESSRFPRSLTDLPFDAEEMPPDIFRPSPLLDGNRSEGRFTIGPPVELTRPSLPGLGGEGPLLGSTNPALRTGSDLLPRGEGPASAATGEPRTSGGSANPVPRAAGGDRGGEADLPLAARGEEEGFFLLGREGKPDRRFTTLEAACSEARDNGVIELRFDGRSTETSLRITRKVTIRAARGRRPVIEFRPRPVVTDGNQIRAVSIPSGSLDLVGVEMVLYVDDTVSAEQWALFSLERPDSLRMQNVTVTVLNPRMYAAAIIELRTTSGAMMPDMPGAQPRPPLEVELAESLFRGQCDAFSVRHAEPARLALRQCIVAVQGALLSVRGHTEVPQENAQLELKIEHVSASLGGSLIKLDSGLLPRKILPIQVFAIDSIFSDSGDAPLVSMTGNAPAQSFRTLLQWNGRNNVYDRFQSYWSITSTEGTGLTETWDFTTWRENWTDVAEANAHSVDTGIWRVRQGAPRSPAEITPADFTLDRAIDNPAVSGATDSTDAGANLANVPRPAVTAAIGPANER